MLRNEYSLAKIVFDTTEDETFKIHFFLRIAKKNTCFTPKECIFAAKTQRALLGAGAAQAAPRRSPRSSAPPPMRSSRSRKDARTSSFLVVFFFARRGRNASKQTTKRGQKAGEIKIVSFNFSASQNVSISATRTKRRPHNSSKQDLRDVFLRTSLEGGVRVLPPLSR